MDWKKIKIVFWAVMLLISFPVLGNSDVSGSRLKGLTFQPGPQAQAGDLIVDGENVTVDGGDYGTILVKNDGKLTINGDTTAEDIVLRWGEITINGNLNVRDTILIEYSGAEFNVMTVYGNNNSARLIDIIASTFSVLGTWVVDEVEIKDSGTLDVVSYTDSWPDSGRLTFYSHQFFVEEAGIVDGYNAGHDPRGEGCGWYRCSGGGGYGGRGGRGYWDASHRGEPFGSDFTNEINMGGKGNYYGGGGIEIRAEHVIINGSVRSNGGENLDHSSGGPGSGGGILFEAKDFDFIGTMSADGGDAGYYAGGGGGGRIKLFYHSGITTDDVMDQLSVKGGTRGGYLNTENGQSGSIWIDAIPEQPVVISPRDNAIFTDSNPTFRFTVEDQSVITDHRDDDLSGIIELSTDNFKTIALTFDQNESLEGWSEYSYKTGDVAEFTPPQPLRKGARYQWRAFTKDRSIRSEASEIRSFVVKLTPSKAEYSVF